MKKILSFLLVISICVSAFATVSFASGAVALEGDSIIYKIPHEGETAYVSYQATIDSMAADFVYSLDGEYEGVSIDSSTGVLSVTSEAPDALRIKAVSASDESVVITKDITLYDTSVIDFTKYEPKNYFWVTTNKLSDNGNYYYDPDGTRQDTTGFGYVRYDGPANPVGTQSPVNAYTIEFDTKISAARIDSNPEFVFLGEANNGKKNNWYGYIYFKNLSADGKYADIIYNNGKDYNLGTYLLDVWTNLKFSVDNKTETVTIMVNDLEVAKTTEIYTIAEWSKFTLVYMSVYTAVDNISVYTGTAKQAEPEIEMSGKQVIYKTPNENELIDVQTYSATIGGMPAEFEFSLKEAYDDVAIDSATGVLKVGSNAPSSVTIVATYVNDRNLKAEYEIAINEAWQRDFSDSGDKDMFNEWQWDNAKAGQITDDGHLLVTGDLYTNNGFCPVASTKADSFTLEFDMLMSSENVDTGDWKNGFNLRGTTANVSGTWETFEISSYDEATDSVTLVSLGGVLGTYANGSWANIKVAFNAEKGYHDIYVNGIYIMRKYHETTVCYLNSIRLWNLTFDNIKIYTGALTASVLADKDIVYIPPKGKSANAHFALSGSDDGNVVWSIMGEYDGISVNSATGVLTVCDNAPEASIMIAAKNESGAILGTCTVKTINTEFAGSANGYIDAVLAEYDGETVLKSKNGNIYYQFAEGNLKGRFVVEGSFLSEGKNLAISSSIHGQSSWATWIPEYRTNEWVDFKSIIDTEKKTVTGIIGGRIYSKTDYPFSLTDPGMTDISINNLIMTCDYLREFKVYSVGDNTPPEAYEVKADTVKEGSELKVSYSYVSESGIEESCSIIKWYKSDKNGKNFAEIPADYIPAEADTGCSFKATVQVAANELKGAVVETEAVKLNKAWEFTTEYINITSDEQTTNKLVANGVVSGVCVTKNKDVAGAFGYVALYENASEAKLIGVEQFDVSNLTASGESAVITLDEGIKLPGDVENCVVKVIITNNTLKPLSKAYLCDASQKQLILMGDSIFHDYHLTESDTGAMTGIGEVIGDYLTDNVTVVNRAYSGHTTKKYLTYTTYEECGYDEMFTWEKIKPLINEGDMLLITLGINDEGQQIPYNDYMANFGVFITEARALGAEVIIGTPTLTLYTNSHVEKIYDNRADRAIEAAVTYGAPYVDINTAVYEEFTRSGNDANTVKLLREAYHLHSGIAGYETKPDYCHLSETGARFYAGVITQLVDNTDCRLADYIR